MFRQQLCRFNNRKVGRLHRVRLNWRGKLIRIDVYTVLYIAEQQGRVQLDVVPLHRMAIFNSIVALGVMLYRHRSSGQHANWMLDIVRTPREVEPSEF